MIRQEGSPLEGALGAGDATQPVTTEIGVRASGIQPWGTIVLAGLQDRPDPPEPPEPTSVAHGHVEPEPAERTPATPPPGMHAGPRVLIENAVVPRRGGRRQGREKYPFGSLTPVAEDEHGELSGSCIFIPDVDEPRKHIANARKRYRDWVFITRTTDGGKMIWRQQ